VRSYAYERLVALYLREGRRADVLKVLRRYLAYPPMFKVTAARPRFLPA
jgi:hypothetical protein